MKKYNWNISILVIFILLTSSLIGVIAIFFLKQLMTYSSSFYDHYKTYYIAKGWLELSLTQAKNHWIWFGYTIPYWSTVFSWTFGCIGGPTGCWFDTTILWESDYLNKAFWMGTGCTKETAFSLTGWESIIVPLFKETWDGSIFSKQKTTQNISNIEKYYKQIRLQECEDCGLTTLETQIFNFWIIGFSGWIQEWIFFKTWSEIASFFKDYMTTFQNFDPIQLYYFIISNADSENKSFCIDMLPTFTFPNKLSLPTQTFYIKSLWTYWKNTIWLEAIYKQPLPDFLINSVF